MSSNIDIETYAGGAASLQNFFDKVIARGQSESDSDSDGNNRSDSGEDHQSDPSVAPSNPAPSALRDVDQRSEIEDLGTESDKPTGVDPLPVPNEILPAKTVIPLAVGKRGKHQRKLKTTMLNWTDEDGEKWPVQCRQATIFRSQEEYTFVMKHFRHYRSLVTSSGAQDWAMAHLVPQFIELFRDRPGLVPPLGVVRVRSAFFYSSLTSSHCCISPRRKYASF